MSCFIPAVKSTCQTPLKLCQFNVSLLINKSTFQGHHMLQRIHKLNATETPDVQVIQQ